MIQIVCCIIIFLLINCNLKAQIPFDIFPNTPGLNGQAQAWTLSCQTNNFYTLGDFLDSSGQVRPWLASFGYDGVMNNDLIIPDSLAANPFRVARNDIHLNSRKNFLIYGSERTENDIILPVLIEIEPSSGRIINSVFIHNPNDSLQGLTRRSMIVQDSFIVLTSYFWIGEHYRFYVVYLDLNFNLINDFIISDVLHNNIVFYAICENSSSITLIGDSRLASDQSLFPGKAPFIYRLTNKGDSIYFKIYSEFTEKAIGFAPAYSNSVEIDDANNWILSCLSVVETTSCAGCFYHTPYTFKLDSNFEHLIWIHKFVSLSPYDYSQPLTTSMVKCIDDSGFVTAGFNGSSFVYKVNNEGDSLWLQQYIPMDWDESRARWTEFVDIKETPQGNLLLCGRVSDKELGIIRPWIVQLDKYGCLTQGCQMVNSTKDADEKKSDVFSIYPNPASQELFLFSNVKIETPILLKVISNDGVKLLSKEFIPNKDSNYIFSIKDLTPGIYYLSVINEQENIFELHTFIKN